MKNNFLVLLIFLSVSSNAQINRFFYEYKFIPDSNEKSNVKKEMMLLDIGKNGSTYYSYEKFVADSTAMAALEKQLKNGQGATINMGENQDKVSFRVTKQYPDFKTYLYKNVSTKRYKIAEDKKPEWKILPDKEKIGEYNAQKATASFGGRDWVAWFSTDIPFQDGPYKFYGLPGLIVKIEDTTGSHSMTLAGNKKMQVVGENPTQFLENIEIAGMDNKELEITKDKFKKVWKNYVNDPTKDMKMFVMSTGNAKDMAAQNQVFKDMEKNAKEALEKDNNPIEPDLVK